MAFDAATIVGLRDGRCSKTRGPLLERRVEQKLGVVQQNQGPVASDQIVDHAGNLHQPLLCCEIEKPARQFEVEIQQRLVGAPRDRL